MKKTKLSIILMFILATILDVTSCKGQSNQEQLTETSICLQSYNEEFTDKSWIFIEDDFFECYAITKTEEFSVDGFTFKITWDDKLSYSANLGYYGGVKKMEVFLKEKHIQTLYDIEDGVGLGDIQMCFADYNMDDTIDFTIPIRCGKSCYSSYYLFDDQKQEFTHYKDWDYLRIQKINKEKQQILSQPSGTAMEGEQYLYKVLGFKLKRIKVFTY